jgi:hypothetical protein
VNALLRADDRNLTAPFAGQTVVMNEGNELDRRKVRLGMILIGAVTVIAIVLLITIDDPVARFIFAFVAIASLVQTWRARRRLTSLE